MIIILTGLPGSGKTTLGRYLSKKLNYNFLDIDQEIENNTKLSIPEIFSSKGEKYFRTLESNTLRNVLLKLCNTNLILSLGGGTFINKGNIKLCKNYGHVVWLNTSLETIVIRLTEDINKRPLLEQNLSNIKNQIIDLFNIRKHYYNQAHQIININKQSSLDEICNLIIENI